MLSNPVGSTAPLFLDGLRPLVVSLGRPDFDRSKTLMQSQIKKKRKRNRSWCHGKNKKRMDTAVKEALQNDKKTIKEIAKEYEIPYHSLYWHVKKAKN